MARPKGYKHTAETKAKMSATKLGCRWYTNGIEETWVTQEKEPPSGFYPGRRKRYCFSPQEIAEAVASLTSRFGTREVDHFARWAEQGRLPNQMDIRQAAARAKRYQKAT